MKKISAKDLSTKDKIRLVIGKNVWHNEDLDGRVPIFMMSDGPVGVRHPKDITNFEVQNAEPSIAYPCFEALSQTWEPSLAKAMGNAIANDCIEKNIDIILGPALNIKRLPNTGRNFEYLSEDPLIAGIFGREYIKGVEEKHVGACMKHFAVNNSEDGRNYKSMEVDERTMREIYLLPFQIASEAKPWEVMCSYNLVNGVKMTENAKMFSILRNEFGFDGMIVSDWWAVFDSEASIKAGLDLEMPYSKEHVEELNELAKSGKLDEKSLNDSAQRVLDLTYKVEDERAKRKLDMTVAGRYEVAEKIEEEGIILLKNDNDALPLAKSESILVTGAASKWYVFGGGSSEVTPREPFVKLQDALCNLGFDVNVEAGVDCNFGSESLVENEKGAYLLAAQSDVSLLTITLDNHAMCESRDRPGLSISPEQKNLIHRLASVSKKTVVIIYSGAPIEMADWINEVDAVLFVSYPGEKGNIAIAKVLSGEVNPSGKTTETFPISLTDVKAFSSYKDQAVNLYSEGLEVGYRQFVTEEKPVQFPFGFGLSYTSFEYSNLEVKQNGEEVSVDFDITNTGERDGKEVAELYISEIGHTVFRPRLELKAFKKVFVKAKETKRVSLKLDKNAFSFYSVALDKWTYNHTIFDILIGSSCLDIKLKERINY